MAASNSVKASVPGALALHRPPAHNFPPYSRIASAAPDDRAAKCPARIDSSLSVDYALISVNMCRNIDRTPRKSEKNYPHWFSAIFRAISFHEKQYHQIHGIKLSIEWHAAKEDNANSLHQASLHILHRIVYICCESKTAGWHDRSRDAGNEPATKNDRMTGQPPNRRFFQEGAAIHDKISILPDDVDFGGYRPASEYGRRRCGDNALAHRRPGARAPDRGSRRALKPGRRLGAGGPAEHRRFGGRRSGARGNSCHRFAHQANQSRHPCSDHLRLVGGFRTPGRGEHRECSQRPSPGGLGHHGLFEQPRRRRLDARPARPRVAAHPGARQRPAVHVL